MATASEGRMSGKNNDLKLRTQLICCPVCHKTYSRKEHLRRHMGSHSNRRQLVCERCKRSFNRKDALLRHSKLCQANRYPNKFLSKSATCEFSDQVFPRTHRHESVSYSSEGSKPSPALSWEHLLCQLEQDSYRDSFRKGASYSLSIFVRILSTLELPAVFDPGFSLPIGPSPIRICASGVCRNQKNTSSTWGLPSAEDLMSFPWTEILGDTTCTTNNDPVRDVSAFISEQSNLDHEASKGEQERNSGGSSDQSVPLAPFSKSYLNSDAEPLQSVTNEIVGRLKALINEKPRDHPAQYEWTPSLEIECFEFFGPKNLIRLTQDYYNTWYIHWPVIHKATFDIFKVPVTLLAAMALLSASYSADANAKQCARNWADSVESMVFKDEYFGSATAFSVLNGARLERRLRALQAGHAVCIYQIFEGNEIARRRARRCRFNEVVAMARELGFRRGRHEDLENITADTFNWRSFILKEELVRTLMYMIVLDGALSMMYNMTPKVMVLELQTDLACPEACFQAVTESECFQHLHAWKSHPLWRERRISVAGALTILGKHDLDMQTQQLFTQLGELNLFVFTSAIHSMIFYMHNSLGHFDQTAALSNILRNWKRIWILRDLAQHQEVFGTPVQPAYNMIECGERWRQSGFMKDAGQFWLLARVIFDSITRRSPSSQLSLDRYEAPDHFDQVSMRDLKRYVVEFDSVPQ